MAVLPGYAESPGPLCAQAEEQQTVALAKAVERETGAYINAKLQIDAEVKDPQNFLLKHVHGEPVGRNLVSEHAPGGS